MAPRAEHTAATVFSAQVKSHDEKSILVEAGGITPVRWFLEHGSQPQGDSERPKKRQKISHTEENAPKIIPMLPEAIPLLSVSIDLHFPDTVKSRSASVQAILEDVDFSDATATSAALQSVEIDESGSTRLRLALPSLTGHLLLIECAALPENILSTLHIVQERMVTTSKTRQDQHQASVSSCTLTRSVGPLYTVVRLQAALHWRSGMTAFPDVSSFRGAIRGTNADYDVLIQAYPTLESEDNGKPWTPRDFYESVHATSSEDDTDNLYKDLLDIELFPFQKRAVKWMSERERNNMAQSAAPEFYDSVEDLEGKPCFVDRLQGIISREPSRIGHISGGGLFDEMGLGKTVEVMALVALNPRPSSEKLLRDEASAKEAKNVSDIKYAAETTSVHDGYSGDQVTTSRATLIITPPAILDQWQSELSRHAPLLRVFHYQGIPASTAKAPSQNQVIKDLTSKYDVVLATYQTLGKEIHFARDPPDRDMRHARRFERKRSPLVQIQWWRICLDEAQMVESGVTAAAKVACRLPRIHSWAVSGTPLKKNVQDLHGLMIFLRYSPFNGPNGERFWRRLVDFHKPLFRSIFRCMAIRHTKWHVRDELRLPTQKRVVVTVPFTIIEQQHYSTLFTEMCEELHVSSDGAPTTDNWNPEDPKTVEAMRTFLTRLRQTCLHPQVGGKNRRALGRGTGAAALRTVGEVLEVMIEQNENNLRVHERAAVAASLQKGHVLGNNGDDPHRSEKALAVYEGARQTVVQVVRDARQRLAFAEDTCTHEAADSSGSESAAEESTPLLGKLRNGLRTALQLQHVLTFFAATSYYQIKTTKEEGSDDFKRLEELETSYYDLAKQLRKEILSETAKKAERLMTKIQHGTLIRLTPPRDLESLGGIESRRIVEKSDELFDVISSQLKVLEEWRKTIVTLLLKPLVDDEQQDTTGEEYENSTKQQDELFVYFDAFKAVSADVNTYITGETAPLTDWEAKEYTKHCKRFFDDTVMEEHKQFVHAPELGLKLFKVRQKYRDKRDSVGSVRGLIQEARTMESTLNLEKTRTANEHAIVKQHITALQSVFTSSTKTLAGLEKEVELFRRTQNQRVQFYRQLQEVSDDVTAYKEELDEKLDDKALGVVLAQEQSAAKLLAEAQKKNRFLLHLRDESGAQAGPRTCIICTSTFDSGVLTVCGHQFCKVCIQQWFTQARTCPMCKKSLTTSDLHEITFNPRAQEEKSAESSQSGDSGQPSSSPNTQPVSIYSDVDAKLMDEIKSIDLPNSYGTKIDTLGRHLHWIREHDPGAKSIVFSQYREFLDVLGVALKDFKLGCARLGRAGASEKFKHDPSIDCLLLDAKTDSSGLTLVNATHVFICEPLIQTAVELQAIARVHRIGQTRPTTIWMYLINDTVEEAIYEISVKRRLQHVQLRQKHGDSTRSTLPENAIDDANTEELQAAPLTKLLVAGKSGGELVEKDDLWQCLFGKAKAGAAENVSEAAQREVGRHLRAEAAEERQLAED